MSGCRTFCLIAALALLAGCSPRSSTAPADTDKSTQTRIDYQLVRERAEAMLPNIRRHAQVLAGLGPRQTGQRGCELAMAHIRTELEGMGLGEQISEFSSKVTVPLDRTDPGQLSSAQEPFSHVVVEIPGQQAQRWPAHAFVPNCAQACATHPAARCPLAEAEAAGPHCTNCERPRRLVDLGTGSWEEFKGKDLQDAVVLLDFNSGEAWLRAASLGAYGAIFTEPQRTTVFQADMKYRATLPLHFPRLYLRKTETDRLKDDLTKNAETLRVTVASRLRFQNVPARCLELTIPGKRRDYCFVLAGHFDARCIVPDLSFGAAEVWGIGELIELTRHFATHQPNCDIRIIFTSGHWQSQQAMRDHVAYDPKAKGTFEKINRYFKVAMGVDLDPEGRSVNLINEAAWNVLPLGAYSWLRQELFQKGGWRDETLQELGLGAEGVELFGGVRAEESETLDGVMASRNDRSPLMYAPRYPTAEEPWQAMGMTTFAFQTGRLARLAHNTPLDLLGKLEPKAIDHQLRPQVQITLAVLDHLQQYPPHLFPDRPAGRRGGKGWGGYAMLKGRTQQWDRSIGWFSGRLPAEADGTPLRTFVQAYPVDSVHQSIVAARPRNYLKWPLNPNRGQHRELQSFMFQDLLLLEHSHFQINTVYAGYPSTQYNVVAYSLDAAGRIRYATDFGIHGDSNKSFQCTDVDVDTWDMWIPVSLFECGTLELFHLIDPQRYNPSDYVRGTWYQGYYIHGGHADRGVAPHLRVEGVKDVDSHTDIDRWGFAQYGPDAMIFLPANFHTGAEILLGQWHTNFAVLSNPDAAGKSQGFRMSPGQRIRLSSNDEPTALTCVRQLTALNEQRLTEFERYDVRSPLPETYQQASIEAVEAGRAAQRRGEYEQALANYARGWIAESGAYRNTLKLLLDVVSTTVLYFVLLLPFSFLMERLIFPQRTVLRTAIVSVVIFAVFASILYLFHPGFKLAHNVVVTITAFIIVVMTIPALIMLLVRGVAMLRAIGSKRVITQQSEAESAGVVMAALSLAVSNMRRRKLRTALTLFTITTLVVALVLLTTSSAFDFRILEPTDTAGASFQGLQIFNASDRRHPLLTEAVEAFEPVLREEALVVRRECVNYGYDHKSENGALYLHAGKRFTRLPYFQVMDQRDNLIEYTLPPPRITWMEILTKMGTAQLCRQQALRDVIVRLLQQVQGGRKVRLSDFIEGEFLEADDVDVCLLPNNMAEDLGVTVGKTVSVMGLPLKVKGIWVAQTREIQDGKEVFISGPLDQLTDLDGFPMTAMRGSMFRQGEPDSPIHAPSREMVIVPRKWIRKYAIFPSCVFSVIVIPRNEAGQLDASLIFTKQDKLYKAERLAKEMLNVDIFTHYKPDRGESVSQKISMHTATQVKGSSMMLVVLAVAVLMILAIMTGTVYERMREIHIFSSVGLSPRHVAGMFLIEALVYAGIAAVLGYFVGIIALKALLWHLKATGQQQDFYPNYLGVFVLYSIGMAVLATVASALYPIRLASKIVNPSEGRTWKLEADDQQAGGDGAARAAAEGHWRVRLPFIATTWDEARAMMVYAYDYLAIHQGERSGRFVCQSPPAGATSGNTLSLAVPVWLAPFERNLTQRSRLLAGPTPDGAWWELSLELHRVSGPPYLFRRGATVFINMLCKHLLRWRAATTAQETDCLARSEGIYGKSA